jgi:hypothetical protein
VSLHIYGTIKPKDMKTKKWITLLSKGFILFSSLSLLSVSLMAFFDPQAVMSLVNTTLTNTDAYSSIRGVYGGVGLTIVLCLWFLLRKNTLYALGFLTLLWGLYAVSRTITVFAEGALGAFGTQWLIIESILCVLAFVLFVVNRKFPAHHHENGKEH